jgi:Ca2+-binding RTX toxin-like protein
MRLVPALTVLAATVLAASALSAGAATSGCSTLIRGTGAAETITAGASGNRVLGLAGNDTITGGPRRDCLEGGSGSDRIEGEAGRDLLVGGSGGDVLLGGAGADEVDGSAGADHISEAPRAYSAGAVGTGSNRVSGGPGADVLEVANGRRDVVRCGPGRDRVSADRADRLIGCEQRHLLASPLPTVSPRRGGRTRMFLVRFRALEEIAATGEFFSIDITGPLGRGCGEIVTNSMGLRYRRNAVVRYRVEPFAGNGARAKRWCRGTYRGTVTFERVLYPTCVLPVNEVPPPGCTESVPVGGFSFRVG